MNYNKSLNKVWEIKIMIKSLISFLMRLIFIYITLFSFARFPGWDWLMVVIIASILRVLITDKYSTMYNRVLVSLNIKKAFIKKNYRLCFICAYSLYFSVICVGMMILHKLGTAFVTKFVYLFIALEVVYKVEQYFDDEEKYFETEKDI